MSVTQTHYAILGRKVPYDSVTDEVHDRIFMTGEFDMIYDGVGGEYAIAGVVLAKGDIYEGFELTELLGPIKDKEKENREKLALVLETFEDAGPLGLYVLTHYN